MLLVILGVAIALIAEGEVVLIRGVGVGRQAYPDEGTAVGLVVRRHSRSVS